MSKIHYPIWAEKNPIIEKVNAALKQLNDRTLARQNRGVEGTSEK